MKKSNSKTNIRGIAMIESMLAISIIMIAIMAPLTISTYTTKYSKLALNRIVATYLAEEQIEFVINMKKSFDIYCFNEVANCANGNSFDEFYNTINFAANCTPANPCYLDESSIKYNLTAKPEFIPVTLLASCRTLYLNTNDIASCSPSGLDSVNSPFTRKLYIDNIDNLITEDRAGNVGPTMPSALKLTSVVCISDVNCNVGDSKAITLVYNIYR